MSCSPRDPTSSCCRSPGPRRRLPRRADRARLPVLTETPPAPDLDGLRRLGAPSSRRRPVSRSPSNTSSSRSMRPGSRSPGRAPWDRQPMSRCRRPTAITASTSSAGSSRRVRPGDDPARSASSRPIVAGSGSRWSAGRRAHRAVEPVIATLDSMGRRPSSTSARTSISRGPLEPVLVRGERGEITTRPCGISGRTAARRSPRSAATRPAATATSRGWGSSG